MSTDDDWQAWGKRDPYFGVLAHERFRRERLTPQALTDFFTIGREEISEVLADCRKYLGDTDTRRTLDFGCGVGRLLIPLSEISETCVGVDISDAMREEAARNCARFGRSNVRLVSSLDAIAEHIDPERGLGIVAEMLSRLDKGGCAALHLTYGRTKYRDNLGAQPVGRRLVRRIRRPLSRLSRRLSNRHPDMQMNAYDMNRVLFLAQQHGVRSGGFRFTNHDGHLGAILFLRRE